MRHLRVYNCQNANLLHTDIATPAGRQIHFLLNRSLLICCNADWNMSVTAVWHFVYDDYVDDKDASNNN